MDTVTILRDLWRKRFMVLGVGVLALLAGVSVIYKTGIPPTKLETRKYEVGVASARILVDTPRSQVVEVAPKGSDSLGVRANLLASLMVDGVVKEAIAHRAGLAPEKLIGMTDAVTAPAAAAIKPPTRDDFVLTTHVVTNSGGAELPIIEVEGQAPDRALAAKITIAAVDGLRDYLNTKAGQQSVADGDRLQVTSLGAPQAATAVRGPSAVLGLVAALVVFAFGCATIVAIIALSRGLKAAAEREARGEDPVARTRTYVDDDYDAPPVRPALAPVPAVHEAPAHPAPAAEPPVDDWLAPAPSRPVKRPPTPPPAPGGSWLSAPPQQAESA